MLQTLETMKSALPLLPGPAFCLDTAGQLFCNAAAQPLAPADGTALEAWLGGSAALWQTWDHQGTLELPVRLCGMDYRLTAQPLEGGCFCILEAIALDDKAQAALAVTSQVLRQPLSDLSAQLQLLTRQLTRLDDPKLLEELAVLNRQVYRMARISGNLADLERLCAGQYHLRPQLLELRSWLQERLEEAADLCLSAGHPLEYTVPRQPLTIQADPALLERAILNLLSNALKFSVPGTPITFRTDVREEAVLLQVRNTCEDNGQALLQAAFRRLEQRDLLPDPRWGVGLGLPLVLAIARLHDGTAAVDCRQELATVTLRLPRRKPFDKPILEAPPPFSYTGGMRRSMVELSDCLPNAIFHPDAI